MEQHSIEWYRARLGKITGSMVYVLMGTPRKKDETFTDTAKNYLYERAAERMLNDLYAGERFDEWLNRTNVETFAMRYGTETEELARQNYDLFVEEGLTVKECGFYHHPTMGGFYGDSPDGLVWSKTDLVGCIEIKCPNPNTWMKYRDGFRRGLTLKEVEEKYYWQCQSHMMCTGTDWCDFVYFDKMLRDGLQVQRVERNDEDIEAMEGRIKLAEDYIKSLTI